MIWLRTIILCGCVVITAVAPPWDAHADSGHEPPVSPLDTGDRAEFPGLLVPVIRMGYLLQAEIDADALKMKLAAKDEVCRQIQKIYVAKLITATAPPVWYESPSFNRWLGFGLGVVATSAAVWGAMQVTR